MNDGTDGQELERVANFYTGTEENPTSAQSAPTPRAEQDIANGVPPGNPIAVPIPERGTGGGPGSPPVVATPYNPQSDDGGQVVPAGEPPAGANQDNGQKSWSDRFLDLVRSPGDDSNLVEGAPKARSDITPQLENDLNSGQRTTPGMLRNDGGKNFGHRMGDVKQAMLSDFPKYAAGVMVEVGIDLLAPEEIAALKGLAIAKGFLVREAAKKGGGRVLQFARKKGQDLAGQVKGLLDEFRTSRKAPNAFGKEKQALVDMAKNDKRTGMTKADMEAYKNLNKQLPDPFPANKVRGPEAHPSRSPHSQQPHGHVGPVDHIPITDAI